MTRDQQLEFCKVCEHKQFDIQHGIICSLTGRIADFQDDCPTFKPVGGADPIVARYEPGRVPFNAEIAQASGTKRFVNYIIDLVCYYIFAFVVAFMSGVVAVLVSPESINDLEGEQSQLWQYVLAILLHVTYYTILEASTGRTIGKLFTGTRVVDKDGKTPPFGVILRRSLCRIVPFEVFSFISNSRGWHDRWTDTWVVEKLPTNN